MSPDELVNNLRSFLPAEAVLHETEDLKPYECDGLSAYRQTPMIVVLPQTEEQIKKVLQQYPFEHITIETEFENGECSM